MLQSCGTGQKIQNTYYQRPKGEERKNEKEAIISVTKAQDFPKLSENNNNDKMFTKNHRNITTK